MRIVGPVDDAGWAGVALGPVVLGAALVRLERVLICGDCSALAFRGLDLGEVTRGLCPSQGVDRCSAVRSVRRVSL